MPSWRETREDPAGVDTDRANAGWAKWDTSSPKVKQEKFAFNHLPLCIAALS